MYMRDECPNQNSEFSRILVLTHSDNKRVSGYVPSALRPNPSLPLRTSDTRQTLGEIVEEECLVVQNGNYIWKDSI